MRASLSLGCEEAPLGGVSEEYLTELTVESVTAVRQSLPLPSWQPGTEFGGIIWCRFGDALPGVGALFLLHRWCCARWCLSTPPRRTAWAHGAGSAPGRRRVSWRAGGEWCVMQERLRDVSHARFACAALLSRGRWPRREPRAAERTAPSARAPCPFLRPPSSICHRLPSASALTMST